MWLLVDLLIVGVFAVVGRLSHYGTLTPAGWWETAWPFLAGTLLAWVLLRLLHRPGGLVTSGVVVWLVALVGGMLLRQASGQGTALPFVIVATLALGALLVLPRWWLRSWAGMARTLRPRDCDPGRSGRPRVPQPASRGVLDRPGPPGGP